MTVQDKYNNLRLGEEGEGWGGGAWVIRKIQLCWPVLGQASHFHWPTESQSDSKGRGGGEPGPFLPPVTDDPKTKRQQRPHMEGCRCTRDESSFLTSCGKKQFASSWKRREREEEEEEREESTSWKKRKDKKEKVTQNKTKKSFRNGHLIVLLV